jgi:hypothetical protein
MTTSDTADLSPDRVWKTPYKVSAGSSALEQLAEQVGTSSQMCSFWWLKLTELLRGSRS